MKQRANGERRRLSGGERFALALLVVTLGVTWWTDLRPAGASPVAGTSGASAATGSERNAPFATIAPLAEATVFNSVYPGAGVHTRLTLEADPAKVRRELRMVREMGATWITEYFPWLYLQPGGPDSYDWKHADLVIREARAHGLQVIARIDGVPQWARPQGTTWKYLDAGSYPAYARIVAAFAGRYRSEVGRIIVWNEPNLALEWGGRKVDPAGYTAMLRVVYPAAKAANPQVEVVAAGLAPTLATESSAEGLNDIAYMSRMYDAGAGKYFDALSMHAYGGKFAPETDPNFENRVFRHVEKQRDLMVARGDGAKPVYITEGGWNDSTYFTGAVRPAERVRYTVTAYRYAQKNWPWATAVTFWQFRLPEPANSPDDNWTFVTPDFTAKPVYEEVQNLLRPTK